MKQLDDDIWTDDDTHSMFGLRLTTRMTVVRLDDGGLWLHSPVALDDRRRAAVDDLGPVRHIVAPNRYHHMYLGDWVRAYPDADLWGAPGLPEKRTDLTFDHVLTRHHPAWLDDLDQMAVDGLEAISEVVFLHRPSRTLVTTDLLFNEHDPDGWLTRAYLWWNGLLGEPGISKLVFFAADDREALRDSYERLLDWDFRRIVLSHGQLLEDDARETLRRIVDESFA
jgi:hypothetical protein